VTLLRSTSPARSTAAGCYKSSERVFRKIKRSEKKKKEKNSHLGCMLLIWMVFFPASSDPSPAFPSHLSHPHTHTHIHTHTRSHFARREGGREGGRGRENERREGKKKNPKAQPPGQLTFQTCEEGRCFQRQDKAPASGARPAGEHHPPPSLPRRHKSSSPGTDHRRRRG